MSSTPLVDLKQAAEIVGVTIPSIRELAKNNVLWHRTQGRKMFVRREEIEAYRTLREQYLVGGGQRLPRNVLAKYLRNNGYVPVEQPNDEPSTEVVVTPHPESPTLPQVDATDQASFAQLRANLQHEWQALQQQIDGVLAEIERKEAVAQQLMNGQQKLNDALQALDVVEDAMRSFR